jgi:hypothetical protein
MDERLNKAYEGERIRNMAGPLQSAGTGLAQAGAGQVSSMEGSEIPDVQWLLANRRNQLMREAEAIQALIDALPSKLPYAAAQALRTLVLK